MMSFDKDRELPNQAGGLSSSFLNSEVELFLNGISDAFIVFDRNWDVLYANERVQQLFRSDRQSFIGKNVFRDFPRIQGTEFESNYRKVERTQEAVSFEDFFIPFHIWLEVRIIPWPGGYLGYYRDITYRKRKELSWNIGESLLWDISTSDDLSSAFEKVLRTLIKNTPWSFGQIWRFKSGHVFIHEKDPFVSTGERQLIFREASVGRHFPVSEGILKKVTETGEPHFIPDLEKDTELKRRESALAAGFKAWLGIPVHSHGRFYEIELLSERVLDEEDANLDLLEVVSKRFSEIVSRRVADEERKTFLELSLDMILTIDSEGRILQANSSFQKILGYDRKSIKNKSIFDFIHPEDREKSRKEVANICEGSPAFGFENRYITKNGEIRFIHWQAVLAPDSGNIFCVGRDKTEDKLFTQKLELAAELLMKNKEELQHAQKIAKLGSWRMEFDGPATWSPGLYEIFGLDESEPPMRFEEFVNLIHPEDRERITRNYIKFLENSVFEDSEFRALVKDGTEKHILVRGEVLYNKFGEPIGSSGTMQDITEQKEWDASIRQFQKMEAVGQLAGGMAHDFNNLLNVILANLDLLELKLREQPDLLKRVISAQDAVKRGAEINRRLLSFSRKQAINPEVSDVNTVVREFAPVLTRIRNDLVAMDFMVEDFPLYCTFERNGLENALLNMGINSRDAMPKGGRILFSVSFCPAGTERALAPGLQEIGDACLISVRDEGVGMDAVTRERIFEPFFTTKGHGKGTGLGMPMVYAFVQQSGGSIQIHSEPEKGTQVDIFLPLSRNVPFDFETEDFGGKKIVFVERNFKGLPGIVSLLKRVGYEILQVYDVYELKAIIASYPEIFAIFADEEIVHRGDDSSEWIKIRREKMLITTSEWNFEMDGEDPNHIRRPYSWSRVRRLLSNAGKTRNNI